MGLDDIRRRLAAVSISPPEDKFLAMWVEDVRFLLDRIDGKHREVVVDGVTYPNGFPWDKVPDETVGNLKKTKVNFIQTCMCRNPGKKGYHHMTNAPCVPEKVDELACRCKSLIHGHDPGCPEYRP